MTCKLTPTLNLTCSIPTHEASCYHLSSTHTQNRRTRRSSRRERERERERVAILSFMKPQNIFKEPIHQVVVSLPSELKITHDDQKVSPSDHQSPKTHQLPNNLIVSKDEFISKTRPFEDDEEKEAATPIDSGEDTGRERLKRHRSEMAGRTWIPDIWGQEELLKDWIDCTKFDASLVSNNIMSARAALIQEGRRANSSGLRIENRC